MTTVGTARADQCPRSVSHHFFSIPPRWSPLSESKVQRARRLGRGGTDRLLLLLLIVLLLFLPTRVQRTVVPANRTIGIPALIFHAAVTLLLSPTQELAA